MAGFPFSEGLISLSLWERAGVREWGLYIQRFCDNFGCRKDTVGFIDYIPHQLNFILL